MKGWINLVDEKDVSVNINRLQIERLLWYNHLNLSMQTKSVNDSRPLAFNIPLKHISLTAMH